MTWDGFSVHFRPSHNINLSPRSEVDATKSTANSFPFAPVTPEQAKHFETHCLSKSSSQEKDKLESLFTSSEAFETHSTELQNIVEKNNFEEAGDGGVNFNKTPQQKPQRKHRPKVLVEGKPKRIPKPKTPMETKENPCGKGKYVRKKSIEVIAKQQTEVTNEVAVPTSEPKAKSCQRKLSFDLEIGRKGEIRGKAANFPEKIRQHGRETFNLNLDSEESAETKVQNGYTEEYQQGGSSYTLNHSINQMAAGSISLEERSMPGASTAIKYNALIATARRLSMRNASSLQRCDGDGYSDERHFQGELNRNRISQEPHNGCTNLKERRKRTWQNSPLKVEKNTGNSNEKRGLKQEYLTMGSRVLCCDVYQIDDYNRNSHNFARCTGTCKKMRVENGFDTKEWTCVRVTKDGVRQVATEGRNSVYPNSSMLNSRIPECYFGGDKTSTQLKNGVHGMCVNGSSHFMASENYTQVHFTVSDLHSIGKCGGQKTLNGSTQVHDITALTEMANFHLLSSTLPKKAPTSCYEQGAKTNFANMSIGRPTQTSSNLVSSCISEACLQGQKDASNDNKKSSMKTRGQPEKQQYSDAIDDITSRLQGLKITGRSAERARQEQNALVPYNGSGTFVPYEGFGLIKKQKPRPKVDLDPKTYRVWKQLMGREKSEGTEEEDKHKEKWWEEERKVFHGRAACFIARMHLVQGDRHFSKWKGSVVDSVIGVFLTQNVSDHLSSSAFMSLAARFPLHSTTTDQACHQSGRTSLATELIITKDENEKRNYRLRKQVEPNGGRKERSKDTMDSLDYEALRRAGVSEISNAIKGRGMNNMLAERMNDFLNRLVRERGSIDLEWLRDVPPDEAKDYLLNIRGLGLKSVECIRLLSLHHLAFPVDTNVGRIAVRLGWVPLQPLPESIQIHLLELYPLLESIQKYLWPRLCNVDQRTLYELHYQMITFGKVFCTKIKPNCNACPMRGECRHFASAFASARLALPGPEEKSLASSTLPIPTDKSPGVAIKHVPLLPAGGSKLKETGPAVGNCEPIVEEPATPEPETVEIRISDIEDAFYEDPEEIPTIKLNEEVGVNLHTYMQQNMELQPSEMSKALVALNPEAASLPTPKLKDVSRLRTEHQVYELPDSHPLLEGLDKREPGDPSPYLLAVWTPGETVDSVQPPERQCGSQDKLCNEKTCFSCNSVREANAQKVRGTILIPCRTAMRGSFPLNGTHFQVNEVFADHESSLNPIDVPRACIWNLPRRTVYFGTSVATIFKGLSMEQIQYCFWRGFVCVKGFEQKTRAPRPLMARLHFPASKLAKTRNEHR